VSLPPFIATIKRRLGSLWWHTLLMSVVARVGDVINWYIGSFLVMDLVSKDKLGAILPLTRLATFFALPLTIVLAAALKYFSVFEVAGEHGKIKRMLRDLAILTGLLSVIVALYLLFGKGFIQERLRFEDPRIIWLVGVMAILTCWNPVARTAAQGLKRFYRLIILGVGAPVVRLVVVVLLLRQFQVAGYLAGSVASALVVLLFLSGGLRQHVSRDIQSQSYREHFPEMWRYALPVGIGILATTLQLTMEPWIIRQRLPEAQSAAYYAAMMFGSIPMILGSAIIPFLFPLVSEKHERGESTRDMHMQTLGIVFLVGILTTLALVFFSDDILGLRASWRAHLHAAPIVWQVGLVMTLHMVMQCHIQHENACRRFRYLKYYAPTVVLEVVLLYSLMGWSVFKPWLPEGLWRSVNGFVVRDLQFIVLFMIAARLITSAGMAVDVAITWRRAHTAPADGPSS